MISEKSDNLLRTLHRRAIHYGFTKAGTLYPDSRREIEAHIESLEKRIDLSTETLEKLRDICAGSDRPALIEIYNIVNTTLDKLREE